MIRQLGDEGPLYGGARSSSSPPLGWISFVRICIAVEFLGLAVIGSLFSGCNGATRRSFKTWVLLEGDMQVFRIIQGQYTKSLSSMLRLQAGIDKLSPYPMTACEFRVLSASSWRTEVLMLVGPVSLDTMSEVTSDHHRETPHRRVQRDSKSNITTPGQLP